MENIDSSENGPVADVHGLFAVNVDHMVSDKGDKGIDLEQLPEDRVPWEFSTASSSAQ